MQLVFVLIWRVAQGNVYANEMYSPEQVECRTASRAYCHDSDNERHKYEIRERTWGCGIRQEDTLATSQNGMYVSSRNRTIKDEIW